MYLDLAELDEVFAGRWLWSARRPALAMFCRRDHLGDPAVPLERAVRDLVESHGRPRPQGPIRLLTHLRYFGYVMNPLSLYFCFDKAGKKVETVVAEVNNTPWGEQHCYVLGSEQFGSQSLRGGGLKKEFHVSPFLSMNMHYRWQITQPAEELHVHIENHEQDQKVFDVLLSLRRLPLTSSNLARVLFRYPFMTGQVIAGIYWQAVRLWWKGCQFYPHPPSRPAPVASPNPLSLPAR